jgi:hypothetical protein
VVNDLDSGAASAVAEEIKGLAVAGDAGTGQGVTQLIDTARGFLGEIDVHCLCPQGVRAQMLAGSGRPGEVLLAAAAIEAEQVADALWQAIEAGTFLVLPHPEVRDYYVARASDTGKWLRGMNRLQQRIEES